MEREREITILLRFLMLQTLFLFLFVPRYQSQGFLLAITLSPFVFVVSCLNRGLRIGGFEDRYQISSPRGWLKAVIDKDHFFHEHGVIFDTKKWDMSLVLSVGILVRHNRQIFF